MPHIQLENAKCLDNADRMPCRSKFKFGLISMFIFIEFLDLGEDRTIPVLPETSQMEGFRSLQGKKLNQLLAIGKASTERVLCNNDQANSTFETRLKFIAKPVTPHRMFPNGVTEISGR